MNKGMASMSSLRSGSRVEGSRHAGRLWRALLIAASLWTGLFLSKEAAAAPVSIGLLGIDGSGAEPGMGQTLTETLYRHIPSLQGIRVEKSQQDLVEVKLVFGCTDEGPACMAKVGKSLGVDRLIYGSIRKQPQGNLYTVAIKQLNVADNTVEKFITEAVRPEVLAPGNAELDELVQRWLRVLLLEGLRGGLRVISQPTGATVELDGMPVGQTPLNLAEVEVGEHMLNIGLAGHVGVSHKVHIRGGQLHEVTATLPLRTSGRSASSGRATDWNRALRITSYVAAGLAGVAAIAAIGTWRGYVGAEDNASSSLDQLQRRLTGNGTVGTYRDFFTSSAQLSSCTQVAGLQADKDYQGYLADCQRGTSLAQASTGLWVVAGGFAVVSATTALLASLRRSSVESGDSRPESPAAPSPSVAPTPVPSSVPPAAPAAPATARGPGIRLVNLAPAVGPDGAGLFAAFRF